MYTWAVDVCALHIKCLTQKLSVKVKNLTLGVKQKMEHQEQTKLLTCDSNPSNMLCVVLLCNFQCRLHYHSGERCMDLWQVAAPQQYSSKVLIIVCCYFL